MNEEEKEIKENEETGNNEIENFLNLKKENDELKDKYSQLEKNYKSDKLKYFNNVLNSTPKVEEKKYTSDDVKKLARKLASGNGNLSNLEYWETALELKEAYKEVYKKNLFNAKGDSDDEEKANKVADKIADMIKESEGDPTAFNMLYNRDVIDSKPRAKKTIL